uniref:Uncharacterized protein n=1 Tax=Ditylum brightwellii TaxID=49249 RepID=A0A6V2NWX6_9STRA|mmetsp:Transcript_2507/g.3355  ORF Transcript_2507/g.3355 Transcript_2507/m.3355 type:complete len:342 (+) Transcript_2507:159-1184(+)
MKLITFLCRRQSRVLLFCAICVLCGLQVRKNDPSKSRGIHTSSIPFPSATAAFSILPLERSVNTVPPTPRKLSIENNNMRVENHHDNYITSRSPSLVSSVVSSQESDELNSIKVIDPLSSEKPQGISSTLSLDSLSPSQLKREPLRYEFAGFTIWLELEQFDSDLSNAIQYFADTHGLLPLPRPHVTALYGMTHLNESEAISLFRSIPSHLPEKRWPAFQRPVGVLMDIAQNGVNGEFCDMAWSELTFATNDNQELSVDTLYEIFYGKESKEFATRQKPFKPHASIAYDNPEETVLSLGGLMGYVLNNPTLMEMGRKVEAISLWSLYGPMAEWKLIDRIQF